MRNDAFESENERLTFSLLHIFRFVTIAAIYCGVIRLAGHFYALLFLALIVHLCVLQIRRIRGLVVGSIFGAGLAALLTLGCGVVCGELGSFQFVLAMLLAPVAGYILGIAFSMDEQCRLGI